MIIILVGIASGWLVNYFSDTLPLFRRLERPGCSLCYEPMSWSDYLLFRVCPSCHRFPIIRRIIVYLFYLGASCFFWLEPSRRLGYWIGVMVLLYLGIVFVIDFEHRLVLHPVSIAGAVLALGIGTWLHGIGDTLLGGALGFGCMYALYWLGEKYAEWVARKQGMPLDEVALGFGDVNMSGILGLFVGYKVVPAAILITILVGGLVSLAFLVILWLQKKYQPHTAIPYAPFIVISLFLLFFVI